MPIIDAHDQEPELAADGTETHPAYALLRVSRVSGQRSLFKSEIQHQHYISLTLTRASIKRDLNRDWVHHEGTELFTVDMSMAQWGQFVSSAGLGSGTPVTLARADGKRVPGIPYAPRIAKNLDEVRSVTAKSLAAIAEVAEELAAVVDAGKPKITVLRGLVGRLRHAVGGAPERAAFAVSSLSEAAEELVEAAQSDIEARLLDMSASLPAAAAAVETPAVPALSREED